jgi:TM2 domain-containing membrane protein YozV
MKKSTKAASLSGFVFPGAGHLYFKHYISGGILSGIAAVASFLLITNIMSRAVEIANKIQSGEVTANILTIVELIRQQTEAVNTPTLSIATYTLMTVWLISVIDSYRIGKL